MQSGEAQAMISHALSHGKVRYQEAYDLYNALYKGTTLYDVVVYPIVLLTFSSYLLLLLHTT